VAGGFALVVAASGLVLIGPLSRALAGDIGVAVELRAYLVPWLFFFIVPTLNGVLMFAVNATGWTRFGLIQTVLAIGFVMAFTPLFVAVFHLGLTGVAISDGLSDTMLLLLGCWAIYKFRKELALGDWRPSHKRPDFTLWKEIVGVGLFYQAARAMDFVAQGFMIRILMESERASDVAAYGVTMLLIGNVTGALSCVGVAGSIMVGQNVGAKQPDRARQVLRTTVIWLVGISCVLVAIATFPQPLIRVFSSDPAVIERATATVHGLRWTMPAGLVSATLLRSYTAVSKNKLGATLSIVCALAAMLIASVVSGNPLERVITGLVASQYLRVAVLALFYKRSFVDVIERRA
jgi:Na+-driven multidrug efflux pump